MESLIKMKWNTYTTKSGKEVKQSVKIQSNGGEEGWGAPTKVFWSINSKKINRAVEHTYKIQKPTTRYIYRTKPVKHRHLPTIYVTINTTEQSKKQTQTIIVKDQLPVAAAASWLDWRSVQGVLLE